MDVEVKKQTSPEMAEPVGDTEDKKKMDIHSDEFWQNRFQRFVSFEDDIQIIPASSEAQPVNEDVTSDDATKQREFHKKALEKLLNSKMKNPETGNMIKVATALEYDKTSTVYKDAAAKVKQLSIKASPKIAAKVKGKKEEKAKTAQIKAHKEKVIASVKAPKNPENSIYGDKLDIDSIDISNITPKTIDAIRKTNMMEYYSKVIDCIATKVKQES